MPFGKTLLITGVSSGIGARTAELAGQLGADVIGVDLNPLPCPADRIVHPSMGFAPSPKRPDSLRECAATPLGPISRGDGGPVRRHC